MYAKLNKVKHRRTLLRHITGRLLGIKVFIVGLYAKILRTNAMGVLIASAFGTKVSMRT